MWGLEFIFLLSGGVLGLPPVLFLFFSSVSVSLTFALGFTWVFVGLLVKTWSGRDGSEFWGVLGLLSNLGCGTSVEFVGVSEFPRVIW